MWRFTPGYHIWGFQPHERERAESLRCDSWAGESPMSAGAGQLSQKNQSPEKAPLSYHAEDYRQESLREWDAWSKR